MESEKSSFRGRIFGGFDRRDVAAYIEKLAGERNALQAENESLSATAAQLQEKLDAQQSGFDTELQEARESALEADRRAAAERAALYGDVARTVEELNGQYTSLRSEVEQLTQKIKQDFRQTEEGLDQIVQKLNEAESRLAALSSEIKVKAEGESEPDDAEVDADPHVGTEE